MMFTLRMSLWTQTFIKLSVLIKRCQRSIARFLSFLVSLVSSFVLGNWNTIFYALVD